MSRQFAISSKTIAVPDGNQELLLDFPSCIKLLSVSSCGKSLLVNYYHSHPQYALPTNSYRYLICILKGGDPQNESTKDLFWHDCHYLGSAYVADKKCTYHVLAKQYFEPREKK